MLLGGGILVMVFGWARSMRRTWKKMTTVAMEMAEAIETHLGKETPVEMETPVVMRRHRTWHTQGRPPNPENRRHQLVHPLEERSGRDDCPD